LLLLTCGCQKVGSDEWAHLDYSAIKCGKSSGVMISNGC
jgi:hypothetical protein